MGGRRRWKQGEAGEVQSGWQSGAETAPQLETQASPGPHSQVDTTHHLLAGGRHSAVGTAQEPQGGPPARLQKLLFWGLELTSSYSNQVCTEYQKGTENSTRLTRPRLEEHTVHPGSDTHTHT